MSSGSGAASQHFPQVFSRFLGFFRSHKGRRDGDLQGGIRLGWAAGFLPDGLAQDAPAAWFRPETGLARPAARRGSYFNPPVHLFPDGLVGLG